MVVIYKLIDTFLFISWIFLFLKLVVILIDEDKKLEKLNDIFTKLAVGFFFSSILLIIIRVLILIWWR